MRARFLYLSALKLSKFYESRWREENATELQRKFKFNEVKRDDERFFQVIVALLFWVSCIRGVQETPNFLCRGLLPPKQLISAGDKKIRCAKLPKRAKPNIEQKTIRLINHNCINLAIIEAGANARKLFFFFV